MKSYNIAFFTEGNWNGRVDRKHPNMRTDLAWQCALKSFHYPIGHDTHRIPDKYYDMGVYIVPKKNPVFDITEVRRLCRVVAVMQEGPRWFWQDWPLNYQFDYLGLLRDVDRIYVHNKSDVSYFRGLAGGYQHVYVLPSLMIHDAIAIESLTPPEKRSGVMIGGNFVSWYGGADSYIVAHEFDTQIYAPSMGRKQAAEPSISNIEYLPYIDWSSWITELSKRKYAVHLMRTHAAGTFALNCAYLGIPCIGYHGLDTQELLHPHTTIKDGDLQGSVEIAQLLHGDAKFYELCSMSARAHYDSYYTEDKFLKNFEETL